MDDVRISIDAGWKQRCKEKLEKLRTKEFSPEDSHCLKKFSGEKKLMNLETYEAVKGGDPDDFVNVLEKVELPLSVIFDQITHGGDSLLHVAARHGNEKIAELVASHSPPLLTKRNVVGNTALHVATRFKHFEVIEVILSQSDSVQNKDEEMITRLRNRVGNTALHEAVARDYLDGVAQLFHKDKAVAHYLNHAHRSPLYMAVYSSKSMDFIRCLLEDLLKENPPPRHNGRSPLHAAVKSKSDSILQELVKMTPELVHLRDESGGTALHYAASNGYLEGVRILLKSFPQAALEWDSNGDLPIHLACESGNIEVVKELLKQKWPKPEGLLNERGQNILHVAAMYGNDDLVKYILMRRQDLEIDLNETDADGNTPLHLALLYKYPKVLFYISREKHIEFNISNLKGLNARDVLQQESHTTGTVQEFLLRAILSSIDTNYTGRVTSISFLGGYHDKDQIKNLVNTLMLIAILIATVTFAAGFTVPGSVYGSDIPNPQLRGAAVLVKNAIFQIFMICNTIAMCSSTAASFILLWSQCGDYHTALRSFEVAFHVVVMALATMFGAFMAGTNLVVRNVSWLAQVMTIIGTISILFILSAYILFISFPLHSSNPWLRLFSNIIFKVLFPLARIYEKVKTKEEEEENKEKESKTRKRGNVKIRRLQVAIH